MLHGYSTRFNHSILRKNCRLKCRERKDMKEIQEETCKEIERKQQKMKDYDKKR